MLRWLILISYFATSSLMARPLDEVIDSGHITIFVYEDYAPYSWSDEDGSVTGIDVEIARLIGRELGVDVEILIRGADESVDDDLRINLWKGDLIHRNVADVMMHVPYDKELDIRNELIVLMSPYFVEELAVITDVKRIPKLTTFARFLSHSIAVELDTVGDFFLSSAFRGQLHNSIVRGRTFDEVVKLFRAGTVPAALGSKAQMEWIAHVSQEIRSKVVQLPMPGLVRRSWPVGIAVKHDSRDLGYAIADILFALTENGEIERISDAYGVSFINPEY